MPLLAFVFGGSFSFGGGAPAAAKLRAVAGVVVILQLHVRARVGIRDRRVAVSLGAVWRLVRAGRIERVVVHVLEVAPDAVVVYPSVVRVLVLEIVVHVLLEIVLEVDIGPVPRAVRSAVFPRARQPHSVDRVRRVHRRDRDRVQQKHLLEVVVVFRERDHVVDRDGAALGEVRAFPGERALYLDQRLGAVLEQVRHLPVVDSNDAEHELAGEAQRERGLGVHDRFWRF